MRSPRPGSRWAPSRGTRRAGYSAYMSSAAWYARRRWWLSEYQRRNGRPATCVVCGRPDVDLHHVDYERLGHETFEDLLPTCRPHHDRIHAAWDASPDLRRLGRRIATVTVVASMRRAAASTAIPDSKPS